MQAFLTYYQILVLSPYQNHFQVVNMKDFHILRKFKKSQTGFPIKKKQGGSSLLGFLTIYLIFFWKYFLLPSQELPHTLYQNLLKTLANFRARSNQLFDNDQVFKYVQKMNQVKYNSRVEYNYIFWVRTSTASNYMIKVTIQTLEQCVKYVQS